MKPKRIQRKRTKGWRMPTGAKYVGRPGLWGNPFGWSGAHASRATATRNYRAWFAGREFGDFEQDRRQWILDNIESLRDQDLACWCPLSEDCHADILIELANISKDEIPF